MKSGMTITSIPATILKIPTLDVWKWVDKPHEYTVANAFSVISASKSLPDVIDPTSKLAMDPLQDPVSMLPLGTSRVIFSSNCTGILGAALDADAGVTFPLAKVSAVVKADYQNTRRGELGMIRGVFNSPFFQIYQQQQGREAAVYAHLLLWEWYRNHYAGKATLPTETFYALNWFNGFSMYWINKEARSADGSINLAAKASYLSLASVSTTASAEYKSYGATDLENFEFVTLQGPPSATIDFQPLDPVDKLVGWAKQSVFATFSAPTSFSNLLQQGVPEKATHDQVIAGVPEALCDSALWFTLPVTTPKIGTTAVASRRFIPATQSQLASSCVLTVTFTPDDSLFNQPRGTVVPVKYTLATKIADQTLEVQTSQLSFHTSDFPMISLATYAPTAFDGPPQATGGGYILHWKLSAILQDDPSDKIDPTAIVTKLTGPTFGDCIPLPGSTAGIPANGISLGANGEITINISQYVKTNTAPDPASAENTTCTIATTLRFKTLKGNFVGAALPQDMRIIYPSLATKPSVIKLQATPNN